MAIRKPSDSTTEMETVAPVDRAEITFVRRSVLNALGAGIGIALGTGTATARERERGERERGEPTFFAQLSDNPSIPGHHKVNSRGKGRLDLVGGEKESFEFELQVRNLNEVPLRYTFTETEAQKDPSG